MFRLADLVRTMFVHTVPPASHVGLHYDVESNHDSVVVEISGPFNPKDTIMRHNTMSQKANCSFMNNIR